VQSFTPSPCMRFVLHVQVRRRVAASWGE
jgi:hypothetical protein